MSVTTVENRSWNPYKIRKPVIKPILKTFDWVELVKGALPKLARDSRKVLGHISDGLDIFGLPKKGSHLCRSFTLAYAGTTLGEKATGAVDMVKDSTSIIGVGAGAVELLDEAGLITLTPHQLLFLTVFGLICSCILVIKSLLDIKNTITILTQVETWGPEFNTNLIALAKKICRLAIGIFGIILFGGTPISPFILLGISSLSLIFSLAKKYYNHRNPIQLQ